jgi:hypothetical protein
MSVVGLPEATASGKSTGSISTRTVPVDAILRAGFGNPADTCQYCDREVSLSAHIATGAKLPEVVGGTVVVVGGTVVVVGGTVVVVGGTVVVVGGTVVVVGGTVVVVDGTVVVVVRAGAAVFVQISRLPTFRQTSDCFLSVVVEPIEVHAAPARVGTDRECTATAGAGSRSLLDSTLPKSTGSTPARNVAPTVAVWHTMHIRLIPFGYATRYAA